VQLNTRGLASSTDAAQDVAAFEGRHCEAAATRSFDDCAASLLRTIESEIIPRLMLAHRQPVNDPVAAPIPEPSDAEQVAELTAIVLGREPQAAPAYVQARLAAGMSVQALYLGLLASVARRLGELWEADLCDFTQVTVGLWRLQQLVHEHSPAFQRERPRRAPGRQAMLVAAPGSQHTFGLMMVAEFFRHAGWQVWGDPTTTIDGAVAEVAIARFDVIGLSIGSECHVDAVASAILRLRQASSNPEVAVLVGGPVVALRSDFVRQVGADATAPDAATAIALAEELVARRAAAA
jgi:methanogenic corrinoid protein MtbC1